MTPARVCPQSPRPDALRIPGQAHRLHGERREQVRQPAALGPPVAAPPRARPPRPQARERPRRPGHGHRQAHRPRRGGARRARRRGRPAGRSRVRGARVGARQAGRAVHRHVGRWGLRLRSAQVRELCFDAFSFRRWDRVDRVWVGKLG